MLFEGKSQDLARVRCATFVPSALIPTSVATCIIVGGGSPTPPSLTPHDTQNDLIADCNFTFGDCFVRTSENVNRFLWRACDLCGVSPLLLNAVQECGGEWCC